MVFHAQAILTPVGDRAGEDDAAKVLRKLSCDLRSKIGAIPFYGTWMEWVGMQAGSVITAIHARFQYSTDSLSAAPTAFQARASRGTRRFTKRAGGKL